MALLDYYIPWSEPVRRRWRPRTDTLAYVVGPAVPNSKDVWRKFMVIRTSKSIVLPTDWNPKKNLWILWGAGGKGQGGAHGFGFNFSGCGGGGGGCRVFQNVGDVQVVPGFQRGDVVDITIAVANGRDWNDGSNVNPTSFVMHNNPAQGNNVVSGSNSGPTDTIGERGLGGDDNPNFPNNLGGLSFTPPGGGGSSAGPSASTILPGLLFNQGLTPNVAPIGPNGGQAGAGAMYCAPYFRSTVAAQPVDDNGPAGGNGPYGTGGGDPNGGNAVANTGGGGGGGLSPNGPGGKGASWVYGQSLTTDTWLDTAGNLEFSIERFLTGPGGWGSQTMLLNFQMLNGTVPAGGGGGAGSGWLAPGNGGDGGWPGGGGGSTDQVIDPLKLPGNGADGLLIILYDPIPPVWFPDFPDLIFPYPPKLGVQLLPVTEYVPLPLGTICPSIDSGPIASTPEICPPETSAMTDLLPIWGGMKG